MKKILLIVIICFKSLYVFSDTIDVRKANLQVAQNILSTITDCGSSIWPGFDLKDLNLVFIDEASEELVGVSPQQNKLVSLNKLSLPSSALRAAYSSFKIGNQRWMAINTQRIAVRKNITYEQTISEAFNLAIHEAFHNSMQHGWIRPDVRGTLVPIKWEPRLYRAMIYKNLVEAFKSKDANQAALQRASYWHEQWAKNYPEEVIITSDGYEGTAQFSEFLAAGFLKLGCHGDEEELQTFLVEKVQTELIGFADGSNFSLDGEGYAVGLMAALILRQKKTNLNWYDLVAKGETPLSQLMTNVKAEVESVDDSYKNIFIETQVNEQAQVHSFLSETYNVIANKNALYVNIPESWRAGGSFSPYNFYVDPKLNLSLTPMSSEFVFTSQNFDSNLKSLQRAVYLWSDKNPCRLGRWSFVIDRNEISVLAANRIEIKNKLFLGTLSGSMLTDSTGQSWFCAGDIGHAEAAAADTILGFAQALR